MKKTLWIKMIVLCLLVAMGIIRLPSVSAMAETVDTATNKIHFIALKGHSDAILLESNGRFGMVDSGEDSDYPDGSDSRYPVRSGTTRSAGFEDDVIAYMKSVGVTKDNFEFYIGTHPHSDHIGSADEIIREFEPERVYIMEYSDEYISSSNNLWDNLYVYDNMIEAAKEVGAVLIQNFDENAPVVPEQDSGEEISGDSTTESGDATEDASAESEDATEDTSVESEDYREYAYLSQEEVVELYDVDPLNPDDPQAANSEPDDGSGFPVLLSDDPNSTSGNFYGPTTGNPNFSLGDMQIHILNYSDDYKTTPKPDCNYFSLGVLVEVNGYRTFLAGDIGNYDGDEERLAAYLGHVDVLKLGHHGLASSNTVDYLLTLRPDYAVSTGVFTSLADAKGRLDAFDQLAGGGTRLYFTREYAKKLDGKSIILSYDGENIESSMPSDVSMIYECDVAPYLYCYMDGYKAKHTGFVTSKGNTYYFGNSVSPLTSQWISSDGNWYYVKEDGTLQTGWMGNYYFDENGVWIENAGKGKWVKDSVGWWYRYPDGTYPKNQWETIDGTRYYFDSYGYMKTGWLKLDGVWYYLNKNGAMTIGWQMVSGKWYYMNSKGQMQTGWQTVGGNKYFLDSSGVMKTGWLYTSGKWYYLNSDGAMQTGWRKVGARWYYMDKYGVMQTGWQTVYGKKYYLTSSGIMVYGWKSIGGHKYYFGGSNDGAMKTGWVKSSRNWYYLNNEGKMQTGWQTVYGKKYYLNNDGAMATGWKFIDGSWYYFGHSGDGAMKTGWIKVGTKWYYLNEEGVMQADCWIDSYYVNSSGEWIPNQSK